MPTTKVTLTGGGFQDAEGNALANGYLLVRLNSDASIANVNVNAGQTLNILLGSNGSITGTPALWPTDVMSSSVSSAYYIVSAYTSQGQRVWGPWQETVPSGVSYDITNWLPTNADNP